MDQIQPALNQYWSARAQAYDSSQLERMQVDEVAEAWHRILRQNLGEAAAGEPGEPGGLDVLDVLDVGTGPGNFAYLAASLGHRVTGIDLADGMLAEARAKADSTSNPPKFLRADAVNPPFPPTSFDAITARYFLWTLREPATALANWFQLLRTGGRLLIVDSLWYPNGVDSGPQTEGFRSSYTPEVLAELPLAQVQSHRDLLDLLAAAGFVDVSLTDLPELLELEQRHGVAPGHFPQMQQLILARKPAATS